MHAILITFMLLKNACLDSMGWLATATLRLVAVAAMLTMAGTESSGQIPSTWFGGSGQWNVASNWNTTDFPQNGNGGFLYNAIIASGNVDLNQNIQVENLDLSGGVISGAGDLDLSQLMQWTGGDLLGTGIINTSGVTFDNSGASVLGQTLNINNGTFDWQQGSLSGSGSVRLNASNALIQGSVNRTISTGMVLDVASMLDHASSAVTRMDGAGVVLDGLIHISDGQLTLAGSSTAAGQFQVSGNGTLQVSAGTHNFSGNQFGDGIYQFSGGNANFSGGYFVDNTVIDGGTVGGAMNTQNLTWTSGAISGAGTMDAAAGTINSTGTLSLNQTLAVSGVMQWLDGSLTGSGLMRLDNGFFIVDGSTNRNANVDVSVTSGGTLQHDSTGTTTLSGSSFVNDGRIAVQNGVLEVSAANGSGSGQFQVSSPGSVRVTGGNHAYTGTQSGTGKYQFSGGTTSFSGGGYFADNTVVDGGTVGGDMQTALLDWSSGTIAGTGVVNTSNLIVNGNGSKTLNQALNVSGGLVQWQGGSITGTGTLDVDSAFVHVTGTTNRSVTSQVNVDPGTIMQHDSTGVTSLGGSGMVFDGIALINNGTLSLDATSGGGFGAFQVNAGATLQFNGGTQGYSGSIQGTGNVVVAGGDVTLSGGLIAADAVNVQNGSVVRISGPQTTISANSVANAGTMAMSTSTNVANSGMSNTGLLEVSGASTQLSVNGGAFSQTAGETRLVGGASIGSASVVDLVAGDLTGNGTVNGTLIAGTNSTIAPGASAGIIDVNGAAILQGTVEVELGGNQVDGLAQVVTQVNSGSNFGLTDFDQLNIYGNAAIASGSTIQLSLINSFSAGPNDFFDILSADSLSVDLNTIVIVAPPSYSASAQVLTLNDPGLGLRDVLRVSVTAVPEPSTTAAMLLGLAAVGVRSRRKRKRLDNQSQE